MFEQKFRDLCTKIIGKLKSWWLSYDRMSMYPWRTDTDLYRTLVAEILLQRTRREAVVKIYYEFVKRFPSPEALARASIEEILELIRPLGLAKRAKYLKMLGEALARGIKNLDELPGVGEYIATLVKAKLFGVNEIALDRNAARIAERLLGIKIPGEKPEKNPVVKELFNECFRISGLNAYEFSLMVADFGYEICRPRRPLCEKCPIKEYCKSRSNVT